MPISGIDSYVPTMNEVYAHWSQVNVALFPTPLVLEGGYDIATLAGDRDAVATAVNGVASADAAQVRAASGRDAAKMDVRVPVTQFRAAVKALLPGSAFEAALPTLPQMASVQSRYVKPFDEMATLWAAVNAAPAPPGFVKPLVLAGGFSLADFSAAVAGMKAAYASVSGAEQAASMARAERDAMLPDAKTRLMQYRQAVISRFAPGSPLIQTLPVVTPTSGTTPPPVAASGAWNPAMSKGVLTWAASDAGNVSRYAVRTAPGPVYKSRNETTVGHVDAETLTFDTLAGLTAPGASALFKVYVVTSNGRQRGSSVVRVTRPV